MGQRVRAFFSPNLGYSLLSTYYVAAPGSSASVSVARCLDNSRTERGAVYSCENGERFTTKIVAEIVVSNADSVHSHYT